MTEPSERVTQRLLSARLRPVAIGVLAICILALIVLGALFFHGDHPSALDKVIANHLQPAGFDGYGGYDEFGPGGRSGLGAQLAPLARLGSPGPITFFTALLCYCCIAVRRFRGAILLAVAVIVASGLTEFVLKPVIHRTYGGDLAFPSGHSTAIFSLAACVVILLADPPRTLLPVSLRLVLSCCAAALACSVGLGLVAAGDHYFTDTVGGAAVGVGVAVATAVILDQIVGRQKAAGSVATQPAEPARIP